MWLRCALYCKSHKFCIMGHRNSDRLKVLLIGMLMSSQVIYRVKTCSVVKQYNSMLIEEGAKVVCE